MYALSESTTVEAKLFLREPLMVAFTLALPLLFLFVMGGVFGNNADPQYYRGAGALDYYVPAYCGLVWAAVGLLALPVHPAHYREDGVLRRLRASAARPWVILGAQLLVTFLISLMGSALIIAMAALVHLSVTNVFALLRLLAASDRDKDMEILVLRHQLTVLQRQLGTARPRFSRCDRAFLAALLHWLSRDVLSRVPLLVCAETVLRWHRDLAAHHPLRPAAGAAPGPGEPGLGLPAHPRRTARPRNQGRRLHGVGDPQAGRDRPRARPGIHDLG